MPENPALNHHCISNLSAWGGEPVVELTGTEVPKCHQVSCSHSLQSLLIEGKTDDKKEKKVSALMNRQQDIYSQPQMQSMYALINIENQLNCHISNVNA